MSSLPEAIPGVSVLVIHQDRVLLVKRGRGPAQGLWALPGGRVETGETLVDAAARELAEETGIVIDGLRTIDTVAVEANEGQTSRRYMITVFVASYRSGTPFAGDDAADARWVRLGDLGDLALTEGTRAVIARHASPANA